MQQIIGQRPLLHDSGTVSFLCLSLLNFWHPTIVYSQFNTWDGKTLLREIPLFYQGITDEGAALLIRISDEVQHLRTVLETQYPTLNLDYVRPSQEWFRNSYEDMIGEKSSFGAMIRSNKAYNGLLHPVKEVNGLFKPDFNHRYLSEDIPNGILAIRGIAELANVPMPMMDQVINWCQRMSDKEYLVDGKLVGKDVGTSRCPQAFHFRSLDDLMAKNSYV